MPALKNQRHEAFSHNVARLDSDLVAYQKAFKCSRANAIKNAWTLRENKGIAARIAELRQKAETITVMDMKERREYMARVKRVNVVNFDPERDGDLIDEIIIEPDGKKRIKLPSKRSCVMDDAKLAGELIDKQDLTSDGEALPSVMPSINLQMPPSFLARRGAQSN